MSFQLQDISDFYQNFPVQSAVLTCGVKASLADCITQARTGADVALSKARRSSWVPSFLSSPPSFELKRNVAYTVYGGIFIGLMCHLEYDYVFPFLFGDDAGDSSSHLLLAAKEVLFDNFVSAPLMWIPPAYIIKALMFGQTPGEGLAKYVKDIKDQGLLQKYWSVWLPAQTLQFSVVPHHLQVAFLATVSFFWFMLFSHLSSKEGEVDEAPDAAAAEAEAVSAARLEVQVEQP